MSSMFDSLQRGSQELMAALWHAATTLSEHDERATKLASVLEALEEIQAQTEGLKLHLLHEANLDGLAAVVDQHRSTPRHDSSRTSADLRLADDLSERFTMIKAALTEGTISAPQASAMVFGLKKLPTAITGRVLEVCQAELIQLAGSYSPHELRHAALEVWALLDPEAADHEEGARLDRERRRAEAIRSVRLIDSCHGYMTLTGRLPLADGALLQAQLDALTPPLSSYSSEAAPSRDARRADALMSLAHHAAAAGSLPRLGLDRPHVSVTVSLEALRDGIGSASLIGIDASSLTASEARRLACDANVIPVVLGGHCEPLDVGRRSRLVTSGIRAALTRRDAGCAFPHCTMRPRSARPTTSSPGTTAALPPWTTSCCCARGITASSSQTRSSRRPVSGRSGSTRTPESPGSGHPDTSTRTGPRDSTAATGSAAWSPTWRTSLR